MTCAYHCLVSSWSKMKQTIINSFFFSWSQNNEGCHVILKVGVSTAYTWFFSPHWDILALSVGKLQVWSTWYKSREKKVMVLELNEKHCFGQNDLILAATMTVFLFRTTMRTTPKLYKTVVASANLLIIKMSWKSENCTLVHQSNQHYPWYDRDPFQNFVETWKNQMNWWREESLYSYNYSKIPWN